MDWRFVASLIQLDALRMQSSPWRYGTGGGGNLAPRMPSSLSSPRLPSSYPSPLGLFPFLQLPMFPSNAPPPIDTTAINGAFQPKKPGRWCAAHVRIAWEIHLNQQIQPNRSQQHPSQPPTSSSSSSSDQTILPGHQSTATPLNAGTGGNGHRRPSLGPSPWTSSSPSAAAAAAAVASASNGEGLDRKGFQSTAAASILSTGIQDSGSGSASSVGQSRPASRSSVLQGSAPLQSSSILNFPSFLGSINERSFAAQLEAIYKYGIGGPSFVGMSPFRGVSPFNSPSSTFLPTGLDGYFGGGGGGGGGPGGLFSPGDVGFSGGPGGSGVTSASSELSRLGRSANVPSFGGSRPWLDAGGGGGGVGGGKNSTGNEVTEVEQQESTKSEHGHHRNHKRNGRDPDASSSSHRRSSGSRDSSSLDSNPSPIATSKSLFQRDRSRSPISRNRPDSTVKLLDPTTTTTQTTPTTTPYHHHHHHHLSDGGITRLHQASTEEEWRKSNPESVWDKTGTVTGTGSSSDHSFGLYCRRDPLSMVDPVLVGLYSGLAGLAGQSYLGPFGFYGRSGLTTPGVSQMDTGAKDPDSRAASPLCSPNRSGMRGERSPVERDRDRERDRERDRKRKERSQSTDNNNHRDTVKKFSPLKKFAPSPIDPPPPLPPPPPPPPSRVGAAPEAPCDEPANHKGDHSPSSTVETSPAPPPTLDAKSATPAASTTGSSTTAAAPLLPVSLSLHVYPPEVVASSSGNVTPDSSSCEVLVHRSEKNIEEDEEPRSVHASMTPLQERC